MLGQGFKSSPRLTVGNSAYSRHSARKKQSVELCCMRLGTEVCITHMQKIMGVIASSKTRFWAVVHARFFNALPAVLAKLREL